MVRKGLSHLRSRVSHAYYKYGRFCASHPILCLIISISCVLLCSYPVTKAGHPSSRPMDIYWSESASHTNNNNVNKPDWLYLLPSVYVQQIIVRSTVDPWDPRKLNPIQAVKGPLSRSFALHEHLQEFAQDGSRLENLCLHVHSAPSTTRLLPSHCCLLMSPTLFWDNHKDKFMNDNNILSSIFGPSCTSSMCPRDLLFGMPTRMTGVKKQYNTNRQRGIDFTVSAVLSSYNSQYIKSLKEFLNETAEFELISAETEGSKNFAHVFYRTRKYTNDYFPLIVSYCVLIIYVYFSSAKIEMVKSKWGLTAAATFTVASSLFMAAGICIQFDLTPTLWGAELFPYLAMIVGLENTLCITRSVSQMPVTLDARSRIAHGLSKEGWSITKNFLTELLIITIGFFTFVPEIQEFCTFACVGLVVDFYMQLFFYAPCLTVDLLRIGSDEKHRFCINQFKREPIELKNYELVKCPFEKILPTFFENTDRTDRLYRVKSESELGENKLDVRKESKSKGHRRAASTASNEIFLEVEPSQFLRVLPVKSRRLRFLYYWTKTRFFQRFLMVVTVLWILWFAAMVHQFQLISQLSAIFKPAYDLTPADISGSLPAAVPNIQRPESGQSEWTLWQKRTFRWWPVLFDHYNLSLSGHYITILPPIVLKSTVHPTDPSIALVGETNSNEQDAPEKVPQPQSGVSALWDRMGTYTPELKLRVWWLELQMTLVLVISCGIFATVAAFILYVCLAGRSKPDELPAPKRPTHKRVGSRAVVESVPLLFYGHQHDIECLVHTGKDVLVSTCIGGQILVWNGSTGDCMRSLNRTVMQNGNRSDLAQDSPTTVRRRNVTSDHSTSTPVSTGGYDFNRFVPKTQPVDPVVSNNNLPAPTPIWALTVRNNMAVAGCSNGTVEIWDINMGILLTLYKSPKAVGVTHVELRGSRLLIARLNGILEFVELTFSESPESIDSRQLHCEQLNKLTAHQRSINSLVSASITAVTASTDHTLKMFDLRTCTHKHTLHGHNAPVLCATLDETVQLLYSSCSQGVVCCWDLIDGALLRTLSQAAYTNSQLALALTGSLLLGYSQDSHLWLWKKNTGELVTRILRRSEDEKPKKGGCLRTERPVLVSLAETLAATSYGGAIQFWDLEFKLLLREVKLECCPGASVHNLVAVDSKSVACSKGNSIYRINLPMIKLK